MIKLSDYTDSRWRELQKGNGEEYKRHVVGVAKMCPLEYLYSLEKGPRQVLIAAMVGHHEYEDLGRTFTLEMTEDGTAKLKAIGLGIEIEWRGDVVEFDGPELMTAKKALSLYHEYGPAAEDKSKRDVLREVKLGPVSKAKARNKAKAKASKSQGEGAGSAPPA